MQTLVRYISFVVAVGLVMSLFFGAGQFYSVLGHLYVYKLLPRHIYLSIACQYYDVSYGNLLADVGSICIFCWVCGSGNASIFDANQIWCVFLVSHSVMSFFHSSK